ncbi:hypothetical protein VMCG_05105 [Cytospora schulzeri]|uniref:Uncharacterized protein n=1 Tax=Cytospora schulzeri TaxID=448051 RepID=A0A423WMA9_9PEZI|nr:hypothetical protein VMCG_05105 [Valsa malicola]
MAISSIRQAMTAMIQANRSLLAQELRLTLQKHIHSITASVLYPSWLKNGTTPPQRSISSAPGSEIHALGMAIHHLCDADTHFTSAGMNVAAKLCMEFTARVMAEQSLAAGHDSANADNALVGLKDLKERNVDSWWGM